MLRPLFHTAFSGVLKARNKRVSNFRDNAVQIQEKWFDYLLNKGRNTAFGAEHHFTTIKEHAAYTEHVPLSDYEDLKPWIHRHMKGEESILWPGKIGWFSKSSGTTADKSKFIPVTKEALWDGHYAGGRDVMASYFSNYPKSKLYYGKGLLMGGSSQINEMDQNASSQYGDISAVMMVNMPKVAGWIKTPDMGTLLMDEWEEKIERIAQKTLKENVTHIAGVPTWTIVLIRKLFEITGEDDLRKIWPNIELYLHGGVSFRPYREQFKQLIPHESMHYQEIYNASEGFLAYQDQEGSEDLLLATDHGIFFEFIPMSELYSDHPRALTLGQVEIGVNYAVVISTNAGLWRYLIGDTVQFYSLDPFRIRVSGRTKHFINAFGEEVMVDNTDVAVAKACEQYKATVKDYTVAPVYMEGTGKGGHEWAIEFEKTPEDIAGFMKVIDQTLQEINSDYEAKRYKSMALHEPKYHVLPEGTFYEWMKGRGKLGGQNKVPRLSNDRKVLEEVLSVHIS